MRVKSVLLTVLALLIFLTINVAAQTPPNLSTITSNQQARGTTTLPGLPINITSGLTLTFHGSNFSNDMSARFTTIDLQGTKATLDIPLENINSASDADSGEVILNAQITEHLLITSGPVYIFDNTTGLISADSVNIVVIPTIFSLLQDPNDLSFDIGRHRITFTEDTLYVEGAGLVQDLTVIIFVSSNGDSLVIDPVAVGSAVALDPADPEAELFFRSDTLGDGLMTKFLPPSSIADAGAIFLKTNSGISAPFSYLKPRVNSINRLGSPLRGTPANPALLSVNTGDTLWLSVENLAGDQFPEVGTFIDIVGAFGTSPFDSISSDSSLAFEIVPDQAWSANPTILNEYSHLLSRFTYFFSDTGQFVQIVPTLDTLEGQFIAPLVFVQLIGSGFRQNPVVSFTNVSGGLTEVGTFSNNGNNISVRIPSDAAPGPVFVQTPGGTSDTLEIDFEVKPLEIIATAAKGMPADTAEASANHGQTITIISEGITSSTRFRILSGFFPRFSVSNISADSTTAEVTLSTTTRIETGMARLEDQSTQTTSETKLLQIVPTLNWVSSGGFAPGNTAKLHGNGYVQNANTVTFTDSSGADVEAEVLDQSINQTELTVRLPAMAAPGLVRISTAGGSDTLTVKIPTMSGLNVTAQHGTPADTAQPSTNIGQVMLIDSDDISNNTVMRFPAVNEFGSDISVDLDVLNVVGGSGGQVVVGNTLVPGGLQIASGEVKLGTSNPDFSPLLGGQGLPLQIVPILSSFDVANFVPGEVATIRGLGLIEGRTQVIFSDSSGNPVEGLNVDVVGIHNNELTVTMPPGAAPDSIIIQTDGGRSLPLNLKPPQIISVSPTQGVRGNTVQMTITGANFSIGSQVSFSGDITVDTTGFFSPEILVTIFHIDVNAPLGGRDVIVTNPSGDADTLFSGFNVVADQVLPVISRVTQLPATGDTRGPYPVQATITDNVGPQSAYLVFSTNDFSTQDTAAMNLTSGDQYEGNIPGQSLNTTVNYYVSAVDFEGNTATEPPDAPTNSFSFQVIAIPVFEPIADQTIDEGQLLSFSISATDPDNDPITFSGSNLPSGAAFSDFTFTWTPSFRQSGTYTVTFTADDNDDGSSSVDVQIIVNEVTNPPVVSGLRDRSVFVGQTLEFTFSVVEPDNDSLTETYLDQPPGSMVSEVAPGSVLRVFRWDPTEADTGIHMPKFIASDGLASDTLTVSIEVSLPSAPIVEFIFPVFGHVGDMVTLTGLAFGDGMGTVLFNGEPSGALVSDDTLAQVLVPPGATSGPVVFVSADGKTSNTKFFSVLPPPTVNLVAKSLDASVPIVLVGNSVILSANIENKGAFAADANVTFFDNHPDSGGTAISSPISFDINPGREIEQSFEWFPQTAGQFTPHIRISGSEPRETKLFDNLVGNGVITVAELSTIEAELIILFAPFEEFMIGQPKNYQIQLINVGNETAEITDINIAGNFGFVPTTGLPFSLPSGTLRSVNFTVIIPDGTPEGQYAAPITVSTARGNDFTHQINFEALQDNPDFILRVLDENTGSPVSGVRIFANEVEQAPTDVSGRTTIEVPFGSSSTVLLFKENYLPGRTDIFSDDPRQTIDVFIEPGEILITNVEVEPLSAEELVELGIDLSNPLNSNLFLFSATLQTDPNGPPIVINSIGSSGSQDEGGPPDSSVIEVQREIMVLEDWRYCNGKFLHIEIKIWDTGSRDTTFSRFRFIEEDGIRRGPWDIIREVSNDCEGPDVLDRIDTTRVAHVDTDFDGVPEPFVCDSRNILACIPEDPITSTSGVIQPRPDVTIPFAIVMGGNIRTLKEFFDVTLAVGNQADPIYTVTDFDLEIVPGTAFAIMIDAEPLPNISGGQSASSTWVLRGDQPGEHLVEIRLSGTLQPGNIPISATELVTITVNEPPQLALQLQHPATVTQNQTFTLSAIVENQSENITARGAAINLFLAEGSVAELQSPPLQELGDIPPGGSRVATWEILSLGEGTITGCRDKSSNNLDFTLQIGGASCGDPVPSDTTMDDDVPPGKVVILGTDVSFPGVQVSASGIDKDGQPVRVTDITDDNGEYKFPIRIHGDDLFFDTWINDPFGQSDVRPMELDFRKSVPENATEMPTLEVGALNRFAGMEQVLNQLKATTSLNKLHQIMATEYSEELAVLDDFLLTSAQSGQWGENLPQTREEYYRLFLAIRMMLIARPEAEKMTELAAEEISAVTTILISEIVSRITKPVEEFLKKKLTENAFAHFGDSSMVEEYIKQAYQNNIESLTKQLNPFLNSLLDAFDIPFTPIKNRITNFNVTERIAEILFGKIAGSIKGEGVSLINRKLSLKSPLKELIFMLYALRTDSLVSEMVNKAMNYTGPDSAGSLLFSEEQVEDIQRSILAGVSVAEDEVIFLTAVEAFFKEYNKQLGNVVISTTALSATPLAPVFVPVTLILERIKKFTKWVQKGAAIGAVFPAPNQLFLTIPSRLENGVNAAFDMPFTSLSRASSFLAKNRSPENTFTLRLNDDLTEAFDNYRSQLQTIRNLIEMDLVADTRSAHAEQFLPADENLTNALKEIETVLTGAAEITFSNRFSDADSIYSIFADTLLNFNANRLVLPWNFILYSVLGELEGGISTPEFLQTRQEILELMDNLIIRSHDVESALQSSLQLYDGLGFIQPTVVIEGVATEIDGQFSQEIRNVPATLTICARIKNLSNSGISGLKITLLGSSAEGLLLKSDSTLSIPELPPGGQDPYMACWELSYQGSLIDRAGLILTAQLSSDSAEIKADDSRIIPVNFFASDMDGDGMPDDYEVANNFDPATDDAAEDLDSDLLTNVQEYLLGTFPNNPDSDDDGIPDGGEVAQGYDPLDQNSPVSIDASALIMPLNTIAQPGDAVKVPLRVSSSSSITSVQFTVDYDSTLLKFENAELDSNLFAFTLDTVNINPDFSPGTSDANKNILIRLSSPNNSFSGSGIPVATLYFTTLSTTDTTTQLSFDRDPEHTLMRDQDNLALDIVSFTDATIRTQLPTAIEEKRVIPTEFVLEQNYPNPFNPTTTIKYQLPKQIKVKLVIYNVLGQKIRTLVDNKQSAGYYKVLWDSKNDAGYSVASGIYFYRIVADDFVKARKMILLK